MGLQRPIALLTYCKYRFISSISRKFRFSWLTVVAMIVCFLMIVFIREQTTISSFQSNFNDKDSGHKSSQGEKSDESIDTAVLLSSKTISLEVHSRYSFIDIEDLGVDLDYLNEEYRPPEQLNIDRPSLHSHSYSRILNIQGNASTIIYNRLPQSYEFTMGSLLESLSYLHTYTYIPSEIYVPFSYNKSALISIARSLNKHQFKQLIYERHLYFFDFYALKFPEHPVWINLVRDPLYRVAAEYENSRRICQELNRCFVPPDRINETLDECVERRSAQECISPQHGISRMVPFFCGLTHPGRCQQENNWALDQAKFNIDFFYTVVGIAEEFYKFLYVLEKLLPQYFKLARLVFMNQQDTKLMADERDMNIRLPNENTTQLLRPLLKYEYDLYDYIKERLLDQYRILMELDN